MGECFIVHIYWLQDFNLEEADKPEYFTVKMVCICTWKYIVYSTLYSYVRNRKVRKATQTNKTYKHPDQKNVYTCLPYRWLSFMTEMRKPKQDSFCHSKGPWNQDTSKSGHFLCYKGLTLPPHCVTQTSLYQHVSTSLMYGHCCFLPTVSTSEAAGTRKRR